MNLNSALKNHRSANRFCSFRTIPILPAQSTVAPSKPSTRSHFGCCKSLFTKRLLYRGVFKMVCGNKAGWKFHCNFLFDVLLSPSASNAYLSTVSHWSDWELHKSGGGRFMFIRKFFPARKLFHSYACKYFMHELCTSLDYRSFSLFQEPFPR